MRALTMVAHPDDCVIFAYGFMQAYQQFEWTVAYLTYTSNDCRGKEFTEFWQRRGVNTVFFGYYDTYQDLLNNQLSFDTQSATQDICKLIQQYDLVVTHNQLGDCNNHPHHRFVHQVVTTNHDFVICFADKGQGNVKYCVVPGSYSLEEIPQHKDVVQGIHKDTHENEYMISERVAKIL
jgi:hypothetical protein